MFKNQFQVRKYLTDNPDMVVEYRGSIAYYCNKDNEYYYLHLYYNIDDTPPEDRELLHGFIEFYESFTIIPKAVLGDLFPEYELLTDIQSCPWL